MNHPNEEQLVLFYYGDADDAAGITQHLADCNACRASFAALKQTFAAVESLPVPERGTGYGRDVWAQLQPRLDARPGAGWLAWFQPKGLRLAGAVAVLLIAAFLLGRATEQWFRTHPEEAGLDVVSAPAAQQARERVLLVAVGEHLERSQMMLVELANTRPIGMVNIAFERKRAEELVADNRLYRQTAASVGDAAMESVLDDLERTLVEIKNSPEEVSAKELASLQKRIEAKGILFKVRVVGSQVRQREKTALAAPARQSF